MLELQFGKRANECGGMTRRDMLCAGGAAALGLTLGDVLCAEANSAASARAKNVLLIYLGGGQTHHDTYDPKPDAPAEIRGKYSTVPSKISGIRFSDQMPRMAQASNLFSLVRSQV